MVERSVEWCQSLIDLSCMKFKDLRCAMWETVKRVLTLLSDEVNQRDKSNIRGGSHRMVQQDSTEPDAVLITEDDRTSCTQTHPVGGCQF